MPVSDNRFDRGHVAEEIEDLGKSERDAVRSQIRGIIEHLLKLACSPAEQPRVSWMETVDDARETLSDKLTETLRREVEGGLEKLYAAGRRRAACGLIRHGEPEIAVILPQQCPYSFDEICREDWYPAGGS
jgi:hypothetical protein